ncbi:MAG TPA: acyltransferase family protein [Ornithinibacter sp.]|nr:acyltransferase family protein [Ornithinibacter sp.]
MGGTTVGDAAPGGASGGGATARGSRTDGPVGSRLAHLDRLKVVLTAGVIVAHAAMSYGAEGTWIYEDDSLSPPTQLVLSVLVGGGVMFVLGLFFLMAGMLTTGPLGRRGPRAFLVSRLWRLGVPVVAYALVVWPALEWLVDEVRGTAPTPWAFYAAEFSGSAWQQLGTGPMWFVAILLVVTVGWCLWRWRMPARPASGSPVTSVVVTAAAIAAGTVVVRVWFPIDSAQVLDVHLWIWPQAVSLFVLGAVGAERGWIWELPRRVRSLCRRGLVGALVVLAVLVVLSDGPEDFTGGVHWEAAGWAGCEGVLAVSASLLVLDWSRRHVVAHGRRERSVARSAYGAFVAQGPVLVVVALLLEPLDVPGDLRFVVLAVGGVLGSFACGWAAVRLAVRGRARRLRDDVPPERRDVARGGGGA